MAIVTVNQQQFYYTQPQKAAGGRTLLLLHGAGGSHLDWPREVQRLPGLNVINLDLPGHGRSEGSGHDLIASFATDVNAFAAALDLEDVILAGHSMGGAVALELALRRPAWLSALVLIGTGASLPVSPRILYTLQADTNEAVALIMRYAWRRESSPQAVAQATGSMLEGDAAQLYRSLTACDRFDVRDRLPEISLPVLVICGTEDRMTPPAYSEALAQAIPGARLLLLPEAGHYVTLEQPQAVAAAIDKFVNS